MHDRTRFRAAVPAAAYAVVVLAAGLLTPSPATAQEKASPALLEEADRRAAQVERKVVAWRRDIHRHPELSNREFRTSKLVADHLRSLGLEVRTGVAHTGVVGVLRGGLPGRVVALRADMDALPVTEMVDLPFASKARAEYNGQEVGVMHACGHDNHVAILMGVAEVLAGMRERIPGTVVFVFQPAEEGAPRGEEGGADLMIREGALGDPRPDAIFGLHVMPGPVGRISYRPGGSLAAADYLRIVVRGRQTHGAQPWAGVDPIVAAAQIVMGLQTVVSRQTELTRAAAVVTIGSIHGGVRNNIIPDSVVMVGTIRTLDPEMQDRIHERIRHTATKIAEGAGATAAVEIERGVPVTYNDPELTETMAPTLRRVAGAGNVSVSPAITGAEDFSYYQKEIPGLFYFLGVAPDPATAAPNHSPYFYADERALPVGVRAATHLALDFLAQGR